MKRLILTVTLAAAAASLAACNNKEPAQTQAAAPPPAAATATPAAPASEMAGMPMAAGETMAKSTGTVTAVTPGSITIDHAPIPEAKWPAMTMTFRAAPDVAKSVKAGDKVAFEVKLKDGAGEVTAISKQ